MVRKIHSCAKVRMEETGVITKYTWIKFSDFTPLNSVKVLLLEIAGSFRIKRNHSNKKALNICLSRHVFRKK